MWLKNVIIFWINFTPDFINIFGLSQSVAFCRTKITVIAVIWDLTWRTLNLSVSFPEKMMKKSAVKVGVLIK